VLELFSAIIGAFFLFVHCQFTVVIVVSERTLNSRIPVSYVVMLRCDFFDIDMDIYRRIKVYIFTLTYLRNIDITVDIAILHQYQSI